MKAWMCALSLFVAVMASMPAWAAKERLVLMPLRVSAEDKSLQSAMETAVVKGLQHKYEVFSGEQVAKKAREIFTKESRNTSKTECDETRCMQGIAEAFQAELIATTNVTKHSDGYFLALSIRNIFDNKVVYSESLPCKYCDAFVVVEKLKLLAGGGEPAASTGASQVVQAASTIQDRTNAGECGYCPDMVAIPGGGFQMGSNNGRDDEKPVHQVTIKAFKIGKTEVTQAQWQAVMGGNPSYFRSCGDNCPVENVSWNDVQQFIQTLNQKTGQKYRLPSEAEWEYACRAGGGHEYCGSDDSNAVGWYAQNSGQSTHPVAQKQANAFGLYDMSGNVWERVQDCYENNYSASAGDGRAREGAGCDRRVRRGGSWTSLVTGMRSAFRYGYNPAYAVNEGGFRLAQD